MTDRQVVPGDTIGILGGGQLGRMLAAAAARLGLRTHIYAPESGPAFDLAADHTIAEYHDDAALAAFAAKVAVVTYEFENVPAHTANFLAERLGVHPNPLALATAQDRLLEKQFLNGLGIPTAPFAQVDDAGSLARAVAKLGRPSILKTRRLGYDGKGQAMIREGADLAVQFRSLGAQPAILEGVVDFAREISVVAARGVDGAFRAWDVCENTHEHHILSVTRAPANISADIAAEAVAMTEKIAAALDYVARHGEPRGSIAFLVTGDEEGPSVNGTVKLLEWAKARGEKFDLCVLGEPTNPDELGDMIKIGRRGSLSGSLVVHGKQGHVGYPALADNPVHHIARLVCALRATPLDAGTAHFDPSDLEFTALDTGNRAVNVIPAEARALFNIRFNDLWTPATLEAEIRRRVEAAAEGARVTVQFQPTNALAFLTRPGPFVEVFSAAIEAETGRRPRLSTTGGTSDARFIRNYAEVLEFGLVGQTMHAVDERVAIADLEKLAAIYARVLDSCFSG